MCVCFLGVFDPYRKFLTRTIFKAFHCVFHRQIRQASQARQIRQMCLRKLCSVQEQG